MRDILQLNIMSFNTQHCKNYITGEIDFARMAEAIRECRADIVGLNEMYNDGGPDRPLLSEQTRKLADLLGFPFHYFACALDFHQGRPIQYGNGLISRHPLLSAERIMITEPDLSLCPRYEPRCILKAKIDVQGKVFTVMTSHFGLSPAEQKNAVETVMAHLEKENCLLMGDFNVYPDDPVLSPIRETLRDSADCWEGEKLSFPSDEPHCKIDYIFASRDVKMLSADIPPIIASDHRPHIACIEI